MKHTVWLADMAEVVDPPRSDELRYTECQRKKKYSERTAQAVLRKLQTRNRRLYDGSPLHVYPCPYGAHWHVGHMSANYSERKETE